MYRIMRANEGHYPAIEAMRQSLFSADECSWPLAGRDWWIAWQRGTPAAFGGLRTLANEPYAFLCLAGVMPAHRGNGLQKRLIRVRVRRARDLGLRGALTYTVKDNHASSNSLISSGFKLYEPDNAWVGRSVLYWRLDF